MNRREAIAASVMPAAAAFTFPVAASAARKHMGPKFYPQLTLYRDQVVHTCGPVGAWEWDTDYGYIAVVIVQSGHKGHGMSDRVDRGDLRWTARIVADHHHFHPGPAMAHGVLLIPDGREAYSYAWTVPVELVQR